MYFSDLSIKDEINCMFLFSSPATQGNSKRIESLQNDTKHKSRHAFLMPDTS
jgi:hypothetical protein